jgi:hypothetical protein
MTGFLIGFQSQSDPETAYIHFSGVHVQKTSAAVCLSSACRPTIHSKYNFLYSNEKS